MNCPKCETKLADGSKFCPVCGTPVSYVAAAPVSAPTPTYAYAPVAVAKKPGQALAIFALIFSLLGIGMAVAPMIISIVTLANGDKLEDWFIFSLIFIVPYIFLVFKYSL